MAPDNSWSSLLFLSAGSHATEPAPPAPNVRGTSATKKGATASVACCSARVPPHRIVMPVSLDKQLDKSPDMMSIAMPSVPHVQQSFSWDCGLACVQMVLKAAGVEECSHKLLRQMCTTTSIWTVDLAHLLRRFNLPVSLYTLMVGPNPAYMHESFYIEHMAEDERRVQQLFEGAPEAGVEVHQRSLSAQELQSALQGGGCLALVLVDNSKMDSSWVLGSLDRVSLPALCGMTTGYKGHYILVVGFDASTQEYLIRDPATSIAELRVPAEMLETARKSFGTDEDLLLISIQLPAGHSPRRSQTSCMQSAQLHQECRQMQPSLPAHQQQRQQMQTTSQSPAPQMQMVSLQHTEVFSHNNQQQMDAVGCFHQHAEQGQQRCCCGGMQVDSAQQVRPSECHEQLALHSQENPRSLPACQASQQITCKQQQQPHKASQQHTASLWSSQQWQWLWPPSGSPSTCQTQRSNQVTVPWFTTSLGLLKAGTVEASAAQQQSWSLKAGEQGYSVPAGAASSDAASATEPESSASSSSSLEMSSDLLGTYSASLSRLGHAPCSCSA